MMNLSVSRDIAIKRWAEAQLDKGCHIELISGDASFRRYFRVSNKCVQYVLMDSPVELIPLAPFIAIAQAYQTSNIPVPAIISFDAVQGFMLLEDLGDTQLLSQLKPDNILDYYGDALAILPRIAAVKSTSEHSLADYNDDFVFRELDIFTQWLVEHHLAMTLNHNDTQMLQQAFQFLADNIAQQPKVGMHRDFHSRNLMCFKNELYVIDFQDAVQGPVTYDCVSLLRDCYVRWPASTVELLAKQHYDLCLEHKLIDGDIEFNQYMRWFNLTGLQRHIKAAGIFARLNYRDNKSAYMADIPMTLSYIVDISAQYEELNQFHLWISNSLLPAFEQSKKMFAEPIL